MKKSYGDVEAVKGIGFYVEEGKLFAFLGPNGAGKSTTIDILCTLLKNDGGHVVIDGLELGRDDLQIKERIGIVFQDSVLDPLLTVKENLAVRGSFYGLTGKQIKSAIAKAADATGINEFINRRYGKLSGGQRRRADIARALINTPKILFLDEPTTGLDPQTRKNIWNTVRDLQTENNMTVFMTTHYMEEAAAADYVVLIDNGEVSARGSPAELKQQYSSDVLRINTETPEDLEKALDAMSKSYVRVNGTYVIELSATVDSINILDKCKMFITNFEVANGTMDDAFIKITGREIRE